MADEMPARTNGVGVFLELRKRLQCGLLIVGRNVAKCPGDVVVTGRDSSLHIRTPKGDLSLPLPPGVVFQESCVSTSAGESEEEELHFRLRISIQNDIEDDAPDSVMETLRTKETYCFHCQGCTTRLLEDRVFRRVLPLPNGNWDSIVSEWCCHPDPFAKKLLPRAGDCLLGDTFVLLQRDASCHETLREEESLVDSADNQDPKKSCRRLALISCTSCSSVLGEAVTPETLKLYVTQVVVEPAVGDRAPEASLDRFLFLEKTIAGRLLKLSNSLSCFHFTIQTPDNKAFLLLWLLNSDSIMASVPELCIGDESSPSPARALKVLYITCSDANVPQKEVITSWEVNTIGHLLVLPLRVCEELQEVLEKSNSALPASTRSMKCYQAAYLKL